MRPDRTRHYACTKVSMVRTQIYTALPLKLGSFRKGTPCKSAKEMSQVQIPSLWQLPWKLGMRDNSERKVEVKSKQKKTLTL